MYTNTSGEWTFHSKLSAPDAANTDHFGSGLAVQHNSAFIGAKQDDDGPGSNSGTVQLKLKLTMYKFLVFSFTSKFRIYMMLRVYLCLCSDIGRVDISIKSGGYGCCSPDGEEYSRVRGHNVYRERPRPSNDKHSRF